MEAVDVRGRFVWQQLMTRDVPGAKKFYSRLMGWKTQPWPLDPSYTVCLAADVPVAGIVEIPTDLPAETPSHWLEYIGTRDVDGTADAAVRAGGSVVKAPSDMQGAGRYAVLKDPQGALFAIIDPENARPEHDGIPPLGAFSWHELATSDNEAAFAFYSGLFGWDAISRMDMGPAGVYLIFGTNGVQRGGMYIKPPDWPAPPHWLPYGHVPSVDDSAGELESAGREDPDPTHGSSGRQPHRLAHRSGGRRVCAQFLPGPGGNGAGVQAQSEIEGQGESQAQSHSETQSESQAESEGQGETKGNARGQSESGEEAGCGGKASRPRSRCGQLPKRPARRSRSS